MKRTKRNNEIDELIQLLVEGPADKPVEWFTDVFVGVLKHIRVLNHEMGVMSGKVGLMIKLVMGLYVLLGGLCLTILGAVIAKII